jgi:hypothetical protein
MHFTYSEEMDAASLQQGDVLKRTLGIDAILEAVHPHYQKPDYGFFIVLTQSCDLIRRQGASSSRYITIAAVRPLGLAVDRYAASLQYDDVEARLGFCSDDRKEKLRQFVERLLNNNEENYFYLRAEPSQGLDEDSCAFLQLSIALKAELHYDTLLAAKILQLVDSFQHKLGYLVGSSYSRVGTEDWVPRWATPDDFNETVQRIAEGASVIWIEKPLYKQVLRRVKELEPEQRTLSALERIITEVATDKAAKRKDVLDTIGGVLAEVGVEADIVERVKGRLENNPLFRSSVK